MELKLNSLKEVYNDLIAPRFSQDTVRRLISNNEEQTMSSYSSRGSHGITMTYQDLWTKILWPHCCFFNAEPEFAPSIWVVSLFPDIKKSIWL